MMYNTVSLHCNLLDGSLPACIEKFEWHKALCGVPRLQVLPCKDSTQLKYILPDNHLRDPANVLVLKYILPSTNICNIVSDTYYHLRQTPIKHHCVLPENVLLVEDMVAHLGDFGLAKRLGGIAAIGL
ncbi:hypothetical protein Goshw_005267 [Gossypium schwendimanii]|uniref:Protein kinase domain-containing protein n=1 Tax=Gossypium schwendimanii TaxID=34291 RepID=A0A7J9MFR4_GOSSC|nr:hypothetical protein [Gossypium schwendimanii]